MNYFYADCEYLGSLKFNSFCGITIVFYYRLH